MKALLDLGVSAQRLDGGSEAGRISAVGILFAAC
jgi:hypothetical protein